MENGDRKEWIMGCNVYVSPTSMTHAARAVVDAKLSANRQRRSLPVQQRGQGTLWSAMRWGRSSLPLEFLPQRGLDGRTRIAGPNKICYMTDVDPNADGTNAELRRSPISSCCVPRRTSSKY
ncbi:hypothetical protein CBR_g40857 [Chara braunii]|uniref:Uncharacterized protein n=1 Tax=Chara braunii TaxID=69332 RepID=A0A388K287_CHABU|nr:hypothetical protein CBR_g40857 [Chara braunii]|eukprot:GBG64158.1 hypothetical protein CBR_g40857 [Chara braunii]